MNQIAEIIGNEPDWADIFFLIAVIAAILSAIGSFGANAITRHAGWLLSVAVALAALGLLAL